MREFRLVGLTVFYTFLTILLALLGIGSITKLQQSQYELATSSTTKAPLQSKSTLSSTANTTATASEVTPAPTSLTLAASATNVRLQDKSTLSGVLSTTDILGSSVPVPNKPVDVQKSTSSGVWTTVVSGVTDANGGYSLPVTIANTSADYRVVFAGDAEYAASQSASVKITGFVATTRIYRTGPTSVTAETSTTYGAHFEVNDSRVTSNPPIAGAKVDVYRKDAFGGNWKLVSTIATASNGNISWRATVSTPTYWKLVGHSTATSTSANSTVTKPTVVPIGKVYKLPSSAPKPTALAPQPAAVGTGAHPAVSSIPDSVWKNMVGKSWHSGCPVGRSKLAYMTVNYWGFDGYRHRGQMVFRSSHKSEFVAAFTRLYNDHIPLHGMYLVDKFGYSSRTHGADDYASMQHDNTSAFNCRWVDGRPGVMSPHSYGTAVDINPYENPYHSAKGWTPNYWWRAHNFPPYTWRSHSSPAVQDMLQSGFHWTYGNEDAQHFDT